MDLGYSILKGVIQGLTEFLPVSSTAHLTFTNALFHLFGWHSAQLRPGEDEFFDIMLHMGTLLAVLIYFRHDLLRIALVWLGKEPANAVDPHSGLSLKKLPWFIALSMMVTVVFILSMLKGTGLIFEKLGWVSAQVENLSDYYFAHPYWVAVHLMITGCLLFFTEKMSKNPKTGRSFDHGNALAIGFLQGCAAIFHGISRSGSTISAGLATGLDRVTATRYTFLLSIPTFLMAAVYEALKLHKSGLILQLNWPVMLIGTAFSAVVGYICVKYLIQYVANNSLVGFAVYCWALGAVMLLIFLTTPGVMIG
jgi:undecaprenyl-diphosphatase